MQVPNCKYMGLWCGIMRPKFTCCTVMHTKLRKTPYINSVDNDSKFKTNTADSASIIVVPADNVHTLITSSLYKNRHKVAQKIG